MKSLDSEGVNQAAIVVGANGGIGSACVEELSSNSGINKIFAVSRDTQSKSPSDSLQWLKSDSSESSMARVTARIKQTLADESLSLRYVIIAIGKLHDSDTGLSPEKQISELSLVNLEDIFRVNCHLPLLWLKHFDQLMDRKKQTETAVLSARVGSISGNRLGGWYAYRSAKAALNMQLKTYSIELKRRFPLTRLMAFHPGTTDTDLSKPFQAKVPSEKLFSPSFSAKQLFEALSSPDDEPLLRYRDWNNQIIEW